MNQVHETGFIMSMHSDQYFNIAYHADALHKRKEGVILESGGGIHMRTSNFRNTAVFLLKHFHFYKDTLWKRSTKYKTTGQKVGVCKTLLWLSNAADCAASRVSLTIFNSPPPPFKKKETLNEKKNSFYKYARNQKYIRPPRHLLCGVTRWYCEWQL